jgi:hypothetical protein
LPPAWRCLQQFSWQCASEAFGHDDIDCSFADIITFDKTHIPGSSFAKQPGCVLHLFRRLFDAETSSHQASQPTGAAMASPIMANSINCEGRRQL